MEPNRYDYSAIIDRPKIRWPNNARVAFWISPNLEHYHYNPPHNPIRSLLVRTPAPDTHFYAYRDYGNRVGFWRMLEVTDKHEMPCTISLNVAVLDHFPEIRDAMVERDFTYMSHGIYNTHLLYGMSQDDEREFYRDTIDTIKKHTGKDLKGMLGPALSNNEDTPDRMAEAGLIYHVDWFHDDQPVPLKVKKGKLVSVPYSIELNDAIFPGHGLDAEQFAQTIKDQFDVLYEEGAESGMVMCIALHPYWIGQPNRIKYLDEALTHILSHDGVWKTTADEIAEYYIANHYDEVVAYTAKQNSSG